MIHAGDLHLWPASPGGGPYSSSSSSATGARSSPRERLLLATIFTSVLLSSIAFFEPSPHDVIMGLLALICLIARVRIPRDIAAFIGLMILWNVGGLFSLVNVVSEEKTIQYAATSIYLAVAAIMWASIFSANSMKRLAAMRSAYILSAVFAALLGIAGYFNAFPGSHELFAPLDRALGAFKDPNVFGPFLIWPMLFVLHRMLSRRILILDVITIAILSTALLVAFSRGAWFHFALSFSVTIFMTIVTAQNTRSRARIVLITSIVSVISIVFILFLLSLPEVRTMLTERAHLFQSYDVGERFPMQRAAVDEILDSFNGMGPFGFASRHVNQQHNVYLQAFLVYGWLGGATFIVLVISTLAVGFKSAFVATEWQPYVITALAAFIGEMAEGFIIDSDHWRHLFLLLGILWGLWAATARCVRMSSHPQFMTGGDAANWYEQPAAYRS